MENNVQLMDPSDYPSMSFKFGSIEDLVGEGALYVMQGRITKDDEIILDGVHLKRMSCFDDEYPDWKVVGRSEKFAFEFENGVGTTQFVGDNFKALVWACRNGLLIRSEYEQSRLDSHGWGLSDEDLVYCALSLKDRIQYGER